MERILKSIKDLYKGENIFKKHLMYLLLLIIPAIAGGLVGMIDKDTPKEIMIILGIVGLSLLVISIIPYMFLLGFYIDFVKDRLKGISGIPSITTETFMNGVRFLPLGIVWAIYSIVFFGVLIGGPIIPLVMVYMSGKPDWGAIIGLAVVLLIAYAVAFLSFFLIVPFCAYIVFEYVDNGRALPKLFNPLVLIQYMKKAFKDTIWVMLVFMLVSIVASFASGAVAVVVMLFTVLIGIFAVVIAPEAQADTAIYAPLPLILLILASSVASIAQIYITSMVGYAAADNYMDVYKNKIAEEVFGE